MITVSRNTIYKRNIMKYDMSKRSKGEVRKPIGFRLWVVHVCHSKGGQQCLGGCLGCAKECKE